MKAKANRPITGNEQAADNERVWLQSHYTCRISENRALDYTWLKQVRRLGHASLARYLAV